MQTNPMLNMLESVTFMVALVLYLLSSALYFFYAGARKEKAGRAAYVILLAGFLVHTVCIVIRGINAGRLPLTNQYEFASAFSWGIALCFLIFAKRFRFDLLGVAVCPLIFLIIGYASMQSREIHGLMPALQSSWLGFHVSMAIIGYGSFGVAFGVAVMELLKPRLTGISANQSAAAADSSPSLTSRIPPDEVLDRIIYRAVALGMLFLTMCMITGAIWARKAWGSYWSWDPKETWSLITWLIYAIFLHFRTRGMSGRKAAVFAIIGFLCVIFTYIGVNTLLPGLHSYR